MRLFAAPDWGGAEPGWKGCADARMRPVATPPDGAEPDWHRDASAACAGMRRPAGFAARLWWSQSNRMTRARGSALGQETGDGTVHRRGRGRYGPASGAGNGPLGQAQTRIGGRKRAIGVGNGALGQVNSLPQWGLTCPNATRGAREGAVRAQRGLLPVPAAPHGAVPHGTRATGSVFTAIPHFASVITPAK